MFKKIFKYFFFTLINYLFMAFVEERHELYVIKIVEVARKETVCWLSTRRAIRLVIAKRRNKTLFMGFMTTK